MLIFAIECLQAIYMLLAGYFRLTKDLPKPVWRYPVSYIAFHTYAIQVSQHRSYELTVIYYTCDVFDGPWISRRI
jgi:hypothetical protein